MPGQPGGGRTGTMTKKDHQFKGLETLLSASTVAGRGENGRRVNVSKRYLYAFNDVCLAVLVFSGKLYLYPSVYK